MKYTKKRVLSGLLLASTISLCCASTAIAGGVALGATRIIYPQNAAQTSLSITNSDKEKVYLIQSWVATPDEKKSADFVVTPPIFVMQPQKENTIRIMYVGKTPLPTDRESLYYLSSKAIPSGKPVVGENALQIATETTIKMFVRPSDLPTQSTNAPQTLRCKLDGGTVKVNNPSPYYVTLVNFTAGGKDLPNTMVAPKSEASVPLSGGPGGTIKFKTLNDYGSKTDEQTCSS
ncbi:fimbria/pilus periplasmic chaperone [Hafnia alvei]|uniref:fimbria/pilus periplasmic chaperone n=1 Tax=Hafnia alvei TaxID=569 RepID=UPI001034A574|nr:fimbria/pilus periplasmic chaperone [Hafnia alvei]KAA0261283.1 fimbrial chaperone protein FimC [Hafnia alvei]TBL38693.1 fimbrial chaperone protein FimC [Hafnia alvei]TBL83626.1 fimbrial chaperone protein FimC [Hafnia alvei]